MTDALKPDPVHAVGNVRRSLATGAAWMVGMRGASRAMSVLSTLILARLLTPDDFGLVAIAVSVTAMFEAKEATLKASVAAEVHQAEAEPVPHSVLNLRSARRPATPSSASVARD